VLHHARDWRAVVAEAARVLRPGGRLYAADMTARFVDSPGLRAVSMHPRDGDRPTPEGIASAVSAAGLQVTGSTTRYRGWWTALVAGER
jgi:ubiquinone/menaquinone biosynthesis C-methylase UbiE